MRSRGFGLCRITQAVGGSRLVCVGLFLVLARPGQDHTDHFLEYGSRIVRTIRYW
jgi:hypothetical protein